MNHNIKNQLDRNFITPAERKKIEQITAEVRDFLKGENKLLQKNPDSSSEKTEEEWNYEEWKK